MTLHRPTPADEPFKVVKEVQMVDATDGPNGSSNGGASPVNGNGLLRSLSQRRASAPMAPAFMVSAPGKVIVFGEHSVVYGKVRILLA
jgi:mevalonate kinase